MRTGLEHVNITATDPLRTAQMMCALFDWHIRWQGAAINDGETVHVGTDDTYVAIYSCGESTLAGAPTYQVKGGLNHIGVLVGDLAATEARVRKAGWRTYGHGDYAPGRRFYFRDSDDIEYEVVSYSETEGD